MRGIDIADQARPGGAAPGGSGGELEHLEHVAHGQFSELLGIGVLGGAKRRGGGDEMCDGRRIMRREDAIGEADIGEVAAGGVGARVDADRTAGQRESATRCA